MASSSGRAQAPVKVPLAKAFIKALRKEYVSCEGPAVGNFFDSLPDADSSIAEILDPYESQVREAAELSPSDAAKAIGMLETDWGLSQGMGYTVAHPPVAPAKLDSLEAKSLQDMLISGDLEAMRKELQLPDDWDMAAFAAGKVLSGASGGREASAIIAMQEQPAHVVREFQALFNATYRKVYTRDRRGAPIPDQFVVTWVQRVMNDQVWREYSSCREKLRSKFRGSIPRVPGGTATMNHIRKRGAAAERAFPVLDDEVNESWLFHGTNSAAAQGIVENDFRLDLSGSNAGTLYGRGVYLAEHVSKSDEYGEAPLDNAKGYEAKRPRGELPRLARESYILVCRSFLILYLQQHPLKGQLKRYLPSPHDLCGQFLSACMHHSHLQ